MKWLIFVIFVAFLISIGVLLLRPKPSLAKPFESMTWAETIRSPLTLDYKDMTGPDITADSALFFETHSGKVLYQKNPEKQLPIASLTKIMTTIVALSHKNMNDTYHISNQAADMEPDKMYLVAGETLNLKELLSGIFLVSANDAAESLAEGTSSSRADFINEMNSTSNKLGMFNTIFINPTGLEEDDKKQYSTAFDVAVMSLFLTHKYPEVLDISSEPSIYLAATDTHQDYSLNNGINLLTTYPGVIGLKMGYTPEAGLTIVTMARRGKYEVMGVLLGAIDRRDDTKKLLDYSFSKLFN